MEPITLASVIILLDRGSKGFFIQVNNTKSAVLTALKLGCLTANSITPYLAGIRYQMQVGGEVF